MHYPVVQLTCLKIGKENKVLSDYFYGREAIDVLLEFSSIKISVDDFLGALGQLLPRYYSISSSIVEVAEPPCRFDTVDRTHNELQLLWLLFAIPLLKENVKE